MKTAQATHDAPSPGDHSGPDNRLDRVIEAMRQDIRDLKAENVSLKNEIKAVKRLAKS